MWLGLGGGGTGTGRAGNGGERPKEFVAQTIGEGFVVLTSPKQQQARGEIGAHYCINWWELTRGGGGG